MPTVSEYNQFRRLIGKSAETILDAECHVWMNDAVAELTADFTPAPVSDIDNLVQIYHPEVIVWAAINWWWNYASQQAEKHTTTVGQASEDKGERFDRAMQMIAQLQARFDRIQTLGTDITIGNLSIFSKSTLLRLGGEEEEKALNG